MEQQFDVYKSLITIICTIFTPMMQAKLQTDLLVTGYQTS